MSNDTDVYVTLSSENETDLLAVVAYLRNKDRTWGLDIDDVRAKEDLGYSVRLYGWANENSLGNYHITGDEGEMGDLSRKFPEIEINGWYKDAYSYGSLYGGVKSYESSYGEDGEGKSISIEVGSFRKIKIDLSSAMSLFSSTFNRIGHLAWLEEEGSSTPYDEDFPPCIEFSIETDCHLSDAEICEQICVALRSIDAPQDLVVQLKDYEGEDILGQPVWGEEHLSVEEVQPETVVLFMKKLTELSELSLVPFLSKLPNLTIADLAVVDSDGNNILHLVAEEGLFNQVPKELITQENLFRKNQFDQTPISLAHENDHRQQLPKEYRDENYMRDYEREEFIQKLLEDGKDDLAAHVIRNFPNPLLTL